MMKKILFMLLCFCATGFAQAQTDNKGWSLVMNHEDAIFFPPKKIEWRKETTNHIINFIFDFKYRSGKMICREKSTQKLIWTWDILKQVGNVRMGEVALKFGLFECREYPFSKFLLFVPNVKGVESAYDRFSVWEFRTFLYINDTTGELKLVGFKRDNPVGIVTWQGTPKE